MRGTAHSAPSRSAHAARTTTPAAAPRSTQSAAPFPSPADRGSRPTLTLVRLGLATRRTLTMLYASARHFPLPDIGSISHAKAARVTATGTEWALVTFRPAPGIPASVAIEFQDTADVGVFSRLPGREWRLLGIGALQMTLCSIGVPGTVLRWWAYSRFGCAATQAGDSGRTPPNGRRRGGLEWKADRGLASWHSASTRQPPIAPLFAPPVVQAALREKYRSSRTGTCVSGMFVTESDQTGPQPAACSLLRAQV